MNNVVRITLDCGHERWFTKGHGIPQVGEQIWCPNCDVYETVGPRGTKLGRTFHEDFWSEPIGSTNRYEGGCTHEGCVYTAKVTGWYQLRDTLHKHYMREHTRCGSIEFVIVDRLPPGSPPPF